jgi:hypothetical protein
MWLTSRVSRCPGCDIELPTESWTGGDPRFNASAECWRLYGEVTGYAASHPAQLGRWHQTCVDAYGAQHSGDTTRAITTAFALNGLYLVFERGFTGFQVRQAHTHLASTVKAWPQFVRPVSTGDVNIFDVALASSPEEHIEFVRRWGASVWSAWSHVHDEVAEMTDRQLHGWHPRTSS